MDRLITTVFILILLTVRGGSARGQDFPMLHYKVEDGLPSNVVYQVYKDSKGYLWIGTNKGIARYNGLKFETFTTSNGLPDNDIFFFLEDSYGRLWLGTFNGERCFYKDGVFHTSMNDSLLRLPFSPSHTAYTKLETDSSVSIYYNNYLVNYSRDRVSILPTRKLLYDVSGAMPFFRKVSDRRYDIYCRKWFLSTDTSGKVYQTERLDSFLKGVYMFQNEYYVQLGTKVFTKDMNPITEIPGGLTDNVLNSFGIYEKDTFYFTNNGLHVNKALHLLQGKPVSSIATDGNHNYWISTLKDGIYVLPSYYLKSGRYGSVYSGVINYANAFNGHMFYVEDRKVSHLVNRRPQQLWEFQHKEQSAYYIDSMANSYQVGAGHIDIVTGLLSGKPRVRRHATNTQPVKVASVVNGIVYEGNTHSLSAFDINTRNDTLTPLYTAQWKTNEWQRVFNSTFAPNGNRWFSTQNMMFEVSAGQTKMLPQFNNRALKNFAFIGGFLVGYTQKNQLLVCTDFFKNVQTSEVNGHNCIWDQFYKLDETHLLISTSNKYRLLTVDNTPGHLNFNVSVIEDPFIPLQAEAICSDISHCYFFKEGSITTIPISSLYIKQTPPELSFTSLKAGKDIRFVDSVVEISYADSRNIAIYFSTLSFGSKEVFYQYSISRNKTDSWRNLQGEQINLVNIGFGNYVVKVRARTISSATGAPIVFRLRIARPFWFSWWFMSASATVVAIVVWLLIRRRTALILSKRQKEHDTQVRFMKSEYKALNALMNPHFIFNTLNNVQSLVNSNDKLAANEYLRVFADLIRQNMHNVSKELIPLSRELELVKNYLMLEKLRFEDKLSYDILVDDDLHLAEIMVPPLIFQPLVENAIKHGVLQLDTSSGHVHIRIFEEGDIVYMQVRDNGVGLSKSLAAKDPGHESFGLENIRKRIDHLSIIQNKHIALQITEETNSSDGLQWTVASISMQA